MFLHGSLGKGVGGLELGGLTIWPANAQAKLLKEINHAQCQWIVSGPLCGLDTRRRRCFVGQAETGGRDDRASKKVANDWVGGWALGVRVDVW